MAPAEVDGAIFIKHGIKTFEDHSVSLRMT